MSEQFRAGPSTRSPAIQARRRRFFVMTDRHGDWTIDAKLLDDVALLMLVEFSGWTSCSRLSLICCSIKCRVVRQRFPIHARCLFASAHTEAVDVLEVVFEMRRVRYLLTFDAFWCTEALSISLLVSRSENENPKLRCRNVIVE